MSDGPVSRVTTRVGEAAEAFVRFFEEFLARRERASGDSCDFVAGNPQEPAMEAYGDALRRATRSDDPNWYAYTMSDPEAQASVADSLNERLGARFRPEDVAAWCREATVGGGQ